MPRLKLRPFDGVGTQVAPGIGAAIGGGLQQAGQLLGGLAQQRAQAELTAIQEQRQLDAIQQRQAAQANRAAGIAAGTALHTDLLKNEQFLKEQAIKTGNTSGMIDAQAKFLQDKLAEITEGQSQEFSDAANGAIRISGLQSQSKLATAAGRINQDRVASAIEDTFNAFDVTGDVEETLARAEDAATEFKLNRVVLPGAVDDAMKRGLQLSFSDEIIDLTNNENFEAARQTIDDLRGKGIFSNAQLKRMKDDVNNEVLQFAKRTELELTVQTVEDLKPIEDLILRGASDLEIRTAVSQMDLDGAQKKFVNDYVNQFIGSPKVASSRLSEEAKRNTTILKERLGILSDRAGEAENLDELVEIGKEYQQLLSGAVDLGPGRIDSAFLTKVALETSAINGAILDGTSETEKGGIPLLFGFRVFEAPSSRRVSRTALPAINNIRRGQTGIPGIDGMSIIDRDIIAQDMEQSAVEFINDPANGDVTDSPEESSNLVNGFMNDAVFRLSGGHQPTVDAINNSPRVTQSPASDPRVADAVAASRERGLSEQDIKDTLAAQGVPEEEIQGAIDNEVAAEPDTGLRSPAGVFIKELFSPSGLGEDLRTAIEAVTGVPLEELVPELRVPGSREQ